MLDDIHGTFVYVFLVVVLGFAVCSEIEGTYTSARCRGAVARNHAGKVFV